MDPEHRLAGLEDRNSFHPTFLYESAWNLGLAGGMVALGKAWKGAPPGILLPLYVGGYAAGRFVFEGLRIDDAKELGGLRQNQWVTLALMAGSAVATGAMLLRGRG